MKKVFIFLFLAIFSSNVFATTIAQTKATSLNVRSEPNGKVIFSLPKNSIVAVMQSQDNWAMIMHLPENDPSKAEYGWVSAPYLDIISSGGRSGAATSQGVSGDACEYEYDINAQVCITTSDAELYCRDSYDRNSYLGCEIEVSYSISTNYEGDDYLDVGVECEVEIKYKASDSYSWSYESDSESKSHSLYSYSSESGDMDFDFTFSSFNEVKNVKIDSIECEINSVYKY